MNGSIARRITLVLTVVVSLAVSLAAALTYYAYLRIQEAMISDLIQTESRRLVTRVSRFGGGWQEPFEREMGPSMFVWGESAAAPSSTLPAELRGLPVGTHQLRRGESTWHVAVENARDGRLYVLYDSIVIEHQLHDFVRAVVVIVLGCSILAIFIGNVAAKWLVTPLNTLTERLEKWIPNLSPAWNPRANEVDRLMEMFNRVQDQVDASIADQREFSANLHHEIRLPLTVIRSDAELMLRGTITEPASLRTRLTRIVKSVSEIDRSLESAYSIANSRFKDEARVDIRQCVEEVFEHARLEAEKSGLVLSNAVEPAHRETLSPSALMTVMRNITGNAILHAAPATLVIESIPGGLQFTDSGPGIAPSELANVFDRYFSNRRADQRRNGEGEPRSPSSVDQTGLGLAIAKRVCIMQSWRLDVTSPVSDDKGTRFILRFERPRS